MSKDKDIEVIVIGDSTNNTLSAVRSLGEAGIRQHLILVCEDDFCHVKKSKYIKDQATQISKIEDCIPLLDEFSSKANKQPFIICTFDAAAVFINNRESDLSKKFLTPCRGGNLGNLFYKDKQCLLADKCGLTVPKSINFSRGNSTDHIDIPYPILLKPNNSTKGEKGDIHICKNKNDIVAALKHESNCSDFILQEFIDKEYEINCIGVSTDDGIVIAGGIKKIRHWPHITGTCSYGVFVPTNELDINIEAINKFLKKSGYYGPFSIEFLHYKDQNYFMEVNFRNDGLAYASTAAGANLHAKYIRPDFKIGKVKPTYMMNYSIDYLYVKNGEVSKKDWWRDFFRTRCFININFKDLAPTFSYYKNKIASKLR